MKALIINSSPHKKGNTKTMIDEFARNFDGEIETLNLYDRPIKPCLDCGSCRRAVGCAIKDDFSKITSNDYDIPFSAIKKNLTTIILYSLNTSERSSSFMPRRVIN